MLAWWIALYYPAIFLLMYVGNRLDKKRGESRRRDQALGCLFMGLVLFPIVFNIIQIVFGLRR
jgi:hypothetical protein